MNRAMGAIATLAIISGSVYADVFSPAASHVGFPKMFLVWFLVSWLFGAAISAVCTAGAVSLSRRTRGSARGATWPFIAAFAAAAIVGWSVGVRATEFLA